VQQPFPASQLNAAVAPTPYDAQGAVGGPDVFVRDAEFHEVLCADLPEETAAIMAASQRPVSFAALTEQAEHAGSRDVPSWYLVSEKDNALPPDAQRFMATRMGADTRSADGSHAAFIAHPDVTAGLISEAAESVA
jgi:pimeloyl-ACP methyl ester carboxylesterase